MKLIDADDLARQIESEYHGMLSEVQLAPYQVLKMLKKQPLVELQVQEKRSKSEIIAEFLELLREAENSYSFHYDSVNQMDKLKQDILHKFELQQMTEAELLELDQALIDCLKQRRDYKDTVEELEPIKAFAEGNKRFVEQTKQLLGNVRKVEEYHADRSYKPRVLKEG